jgi:acetyltransferase-like isoleucine patch superfamily enzyme
MIYEIISLILGMIKILIYKLLNIGRISFKSIPKLNNNFKIIIKKHSKLILDKNFRARNNISIRVYNSGVVRIGYNCFLNDNCSINCQDKITIGNNLMCGQNVMFFDHDHDYKNDINNFIRKPITVGNNVWIGANCIILKGVKIGDNVVIAAGTIVKENIESNTLVYQERNTIIKKVKKDV